MPNGSATNVRLSNLLDANGTLSTNLERMTALQGFLEVKSVNYGGEHAGVVRGRPFHAGGFRFGPAHYVAASDDHAKLDAEVIDLLNLG